MSASFCCSGSYATGFALNLAAPFPLFEIRPAATCRPSIKRIGFKLDLAGANAAWTLGIARGTLAGSIVLTGGRYTPLVSEDVGGIDPSRYGLNVYSQWQKVPPTPASYLRRLTQRNAGATAASPNAQYLSFARGLTMNGDTVIGWLISPTVNNIVLYSLEIELDA